jgi:hypothetical protein
MIRAFALLLLVYPAFSQAVGNLQGTVTDDSGAPVPKAIAVATLQSPTDHSAYSVISDAKGVFAFNNLPAGKYSVCVHTPGGAQLNPCQWSSPTQVTLASAQNIPNEVITVTKGSLLQVRINDPQRVLTLADDLMVGIYLPTGLFQPLRLAESDPTGRTYDSAVPLATQIRLSVISTHLQIADSGGHALGMQALPAGSFAPTAATSSTVSLPAQAAVNPPTVNFTITGRK